MIWVEFELRKMDQSQNGSKPNFQNLNMLTKVDMYEAKDRIFK